MGFGSHVDNAIRHVAAAGSLRIRTDLSATLFLTKPDAYDGGELVVEDSYGEQRIKFPAGDMALYPASSLHRVEPITRGSRLACFFWVQSMVKDDGERTLLHGLDNAVRETRAQLSDDSHAVQSLTATYHNLLRRWAEV
jgi:PKHD-type hydroxylase